MHTKYSQILTWIKGGKVWLCGSGALLVCDLCLGDLIIVGLFLETLTPNF